MVVAHMSSIVKGLIAAGVVPANCTRFNLSIAVGEVVRISCDFFVSEEQFQQIATAFSDNPEEAKAIARRLFIRRQEALSNPPRAQVFQVDLEDGA